MSLTVMDVEAAHKRCERPQLRRGSQEYESATWNSVDLYGWVCPLCSKTTAIMDAHHIVRRREGKTWGGCDHLGNLVPMCRKCHTDNPIRPMLIVKLSKLAQFETFVARLDS